MVPMKTEKVPVSIKDHLGQSVTIECVEGHTRSIEVLSNEVAYKAEKEDLSDLESDLRYVVNSFDRNTLEIINKSYMNAKDLIGDCLYCMNIIDEVINKELFRYCIVNNHLTGLKHIVVNEKDVLPYLHQKGLFTELSNASLKSKINKLNEYNEYADDNTVISDEKEENEIKEKLIKINDELSICRNIIKQFNEDIDKVYIDFINS